MIQRQRGTKRQIEIRISLSRDNINPTECWFFMSFFDVLSTYLFAWLYFMVTLSPVFLYTSSL